MTRIIVGRDGWWVETDGHLGARVAGPYRSLDEALTAVERDEATAPQAGGTAAPM